MVGDTNPFWGGGCGGHGERHRSGQRPVEPRRGGGHPGHRHHPEAGGNLPIHLYSGTSQYAVLTSGNALLSRTMSLPGGASVTIPATGTTVWSYPNLHGDSIITASNTGARTGQVCSYGVVLPVRLDNRRFGARAIATTTVRLAPKATTATEKAASSSRGNSSWKKTASDLNTLSTIAGVLLAVSIFVPGAQVFTPALLIASVALSAAGAAVTCAHDWGKDDCSEDVINTVGGAALGGAGIWAHAIGIIPEGATAAEKFFANGGLGGVLTGGMCGISWAKGDRCI